MNEHLLGARRSDVDARRRRVLAVLDKVAGHAEVPPPSLRSRVVPVCTAPSSTVTPSSSRRWPPPGRSGPPGSWGPLHAADRVTSASLKVDLANERATTARLPAELEMCRRRLAEELGRTVAADLTGSGLVDWQAIAAELQTEKPANRSESAAPRDRRRPAAQPGTSPASSTTRSSSDADTTHPD
jgi:hypothetical protein